VKRKIGGIVLALILAVVGTVALITYVDRAKDDAVSDEELKDILVLVDDVGQGATLSEIGDAVELTGVPERLVEPVLVAGVDLLTGEQLLSSRLVDPETLVRVDVPEGLQEVTISVDPDRAVGGVLRPGDLIGIVISFDSIDVNAANAATATTVPGAVPDPNAPPLPPLVTSATKLTLNKVLITSVQLSQADVERLEEADDPNTPEDESVDEAGSEAPGGGLLVTLALSTPEVEQVVYAAEFGTIWLTRQNEATDTEGSRILTVDQVYVTVPE
jgi:pilus assembly protein CpaB